MSFVTDTRLCNWNHQKTSIRHYIHLTCWPPLPKAHHHLKPRLWKACLTETDKPDPTNPTELVCDELDRRVKAEQPAGAQHLWELLQHCWETVPGDDFMEPTERMPPFALMCSYAASFFDVVTWAGVICKQDNWWRCTGSDGQSGTTQCFEV